ncbi:MAG TPA: hypothetical protein VFM39_01040 [bacterium]|nr:hypothetical protein [bacterium]
MQKDLARYPLLDALIGRRSRRFGRGFHLDGGPLSYRSALQPQPLTLAEEAALSFAACGITGFTLGELPFTGGSMPESGSGNMLAQLVGRSVASADAIHTVIVFVINDDGVWMIRRPQDVPRAELTAVVHMARDRRLTEQYERLRTRIADRRVDVPREIPYVPAFNKWSANLPGSTYFLPVNELTAIYINVILTAFNEEFGYFAVDERHGYRPAGLARFARSRGGHLHDDPTAGRLGTVGALEAWMLEFTALEQGAILQNLGLMAQALGVGGFPHFAAHPFGWFQALGFRMEHPRFSRVFGLGPGMRALVKALRRDAPVPTAVGLERDGNVLIKPFCPPYYRNMQEAVLAFVDSKYAEGTGTLRDGGVAAGWSDGPSVQAGIPRYSDKTIAATIAYCDYVYSRYGRFPATSGPFRTVLAYQAHRLDLAFYDRFYRPDVVAEAKEAATAPDASV